MADLSVRIQKLDISLNILESKLNSIDGLQDVQASKQYEPPELLANAGNATPVATSTAQPQKTQSQKVEPAPPPVSNDEPIPPPASGMLLVFFNFYFDRRQCNRAYWRSVNSNCTCSLASIIIRYED